MHYVKDVRFRDLKGYKWSVTYKDVKLAHFQHCIWMVLVSTSGSKLHQSSFKMAIFIRNFLFSLITVFSVVYGFDRGENTNAQLVQGSGIINVVFGGTLKTNCFSQINKTQINAVKRSENQVYVCLIFIDSCNLTAEAGFCYAYFPSFYYDAQEDKCKSFVYGKCSKFILKFSFWYIIKYFVL